MKHRATAALAAVAALAALTACSSSDDDKPAAQSTPTETADAPQTTTAPPHAGIPPKPTGKVRADLLAALREVHPALVADEDKAVDHARNQCSAVNNKEPKADWLAQQRFSGGTHEVSDAEAKQINAVLVEFCKTA
ncbi:hypothetical protein ACFY20_09200 [Streptomyces sp. NPDC001312]|uniref:hypothetical protein n=1 Tax=Streptomyces sp. NPDC001312 TaxID=3364561 RepID=UPI0036B15925